MKRFPVLDDSDKQIGYLLLEGGMYHPFTMDHKRVPRGFYHKASAEKFLKGLFAQKSEPAQPAEKSA